MHVRVCRDCGEEFRPEASVCSDCGGVLEDRDDTPAAPEAEARPGGPLVATRPDLVAVAEGAEASEVESSARLLGEAGIAFAVSGAIHQFRVLVEPGDVARARSVLGLDAVAGDGAQLSACPACGASLVPGAAECPECGLALSTPVEPAE
jgi:ribosomal protein L40E